MCVGYTIKFRSKYIKIIRKQNKIETENVRNPNSEITEQI